MHRKIIFFIILCSHTILVAAPGELEFWFFAPDSRQSLLQLIKPMVTHSMAIAQSDLECVPMGDGCFNPQIGYVEEPKQQNRNIGEQSYHTPATLDLNLVECDESYAFDLFCGQAREQAKKSNQLEIWFDVSTSMRTIFAEGKNCLQQQALEQLQKNCSTQVVIKIFNTRVTVAGSAQDTCHYRGLNNSDELIAAIMESAAKKVLVISDSDEYAGSLRKFIEEGHYHVKGTEKPLKGSELFSLLAAQTTACR